MLVENEQAGLIVDDAHAPKKRQAVPGDSDPKGMWSPDTPISYYFDETISELGLSGKSGRLRQAFHIIIAQPSQL